LVADTAAAVIEKVKSTAQVVDRVAVVLASQTIRVADQGHKVTLVDLLVTEIMVVLWEVTLLMAAVAQARLAIQMAIPMAAMVASGQATALPMRVAAEAVTMAQATEAMAVVALAQ